MIEHKWSSDNVMTVNDNDEGDGYEFSITIPLPNDGTPDVKHNLYITCDEINTTCVTLSIFIQSNLRSIELLDCIEFEDKKAILDLFYPVAKLVTTTCLAPIKK